MRTQNLLQECQTTFYRSVCTPLVLVLAEYHFEGRFHLLG